MFTYVIQYLFTHQTNETSLLKFTSTKASWLTLLGLETLKNSTLKIPINTKTLSINNQRTSSAKSFNLEIIKKLTKYSFTNVVSRQWLLSPFLRYSRLMVCQYYDLYSMLQCEKWFNFNWKNRKCSAFFEIARISYKLRRFSNVFNFLIFQSPVISQILTINNFRTPTAKSIKLDIIRKLIKILLKNFL